MATDPIDELYQYLHRFRDLTMPNKVRQGDATTTVLLYPTQLTRIGEMPTPRMTLVPDTTPQQFIEALQKGVPYLAEELRREYWQNVLHRPVHPLEAYVIAESEAAQ